MILRLRPARLPAGRTMLLATLLLLFPAPRAAQQPEPVPMLRPGDVLRVTVWRNPELTGDFTVQDDGTLAHPLYREVRVAGLPPAAVDDALHAFLARYEVSPSFVAQPLFRVVIGGEVRNPSIYPLPPTTTLAEAVALAGGVSDRGKLEAVRLQRAGTRQVVDLTDPVPGALANTPIRSGDQLFVERRVSVFREYIAPAGSILAALAAIASLIIRN